MISLSNIFIKYGDRILYDDINFNIEKNEKIGLVGRNGTGKSTMLKIISGDLKADSGTVNIQKGVKIGFLTQELPTYKNITLKELGFSAFERPIAIQKEIEVLNTQIEDASHKGEDIELSVFDTLSELHNEFDLLGGNQMEKQVESVLMGLGFTTMDFQKKINEFSGGWIMRAELGRLLLSNPDLLLLDEPTNHLDIESIIWLENYLIKSSMTIIVISHDKTFLSNVTKKTAEIEFSKLELYSAPYSKYLKIKEERREIQINAFKNQQKVIAEKERTIARFMAKATKTKMAQSMKKQLDKLERVDEITEEAAHMTITFPEGPRAGKIVLAGSHIHKSFGPKDVLKDISIEIERNQKVAFVGQNGQGKTTLVKILTNLINADKGEVELGHNVVVNYYAQNQADSLNEKKTLYDCLEEDSPPEMRTKLRSVLGSFLFSGEDADKKVSVLSGGERARLALAKMILHPSNLLVLDEPTNHLDLISKDVLKQAIQKFEGTVVIVSHDRDFLADLCPIVYEFRDQKIKKYLGDINYFLQKKETDSMREIEKATQVNKSASSKSKSTASHEDVKKYRRQLQYIERDINNFEQEIGKIETQMSDAGFYESDDRDSILAKYNKTKQKLSDKMEEWEKCAFWLEENDPNN